MLRMLKRFEQKHFNCLLPFNISANIYFFITTIITLTFGRKTCQSPDCMFSVPGKKKKYNNKNNKNKYTHEHKCKIFVQIGK